MYMYCSYIYSSSINNVQVSVCVWGGGHMQCLILHENVLHVLLVLEYMYMKPMNISKRQRRRGRGGGGGGEGGGGRGGGRGEGEVSVKTSSVLQT